MQTLLLPLIIGRTQIALWEKGCYVRGRSSGKTGPPGTALAPWYAGGLKSNCVISQAVLTNGKAEMSRALKACEEAVAGTPKRQRKVIRELKKRAQGLKDTLEFME